LWQIELENLDFTKTDFQDTIFSFSYEYFMNDQISLILSLDTYNEKKVGTYVGFVSDIVDDEAFAFDYGAGSPISHIFTVSQTPISVGLKFTPMGRRGGIIPYVGGAASLVLFTVRLQGEMIDFSQPIEFFDLQLEEWVIGYPVLPTDARVDNKLAFGWNVFGGVMFPIANRISIEGEFKYFMGSGDISDTFIDFNNHDLSGYQITVGVNYWF
jgi:opacity protein-like surface antigen